MKYNDIPIILTICTCSLSGLSAILIFTSYAKLAEIRNAQRKILLYLTVANALEVTEGALENVRSYIVNHGKTQYSSSVFHTNEMYCKTLAAVYMYSSISSYMWTAVIMINLYLKTTLRLTVANQRKLINTYNVICWGCPGIVTIVALMMDVFGENHHKLSGLWCWIRERNEMFDLTYLVWRLVGGKIWQILCFVLCVSLFICLKVHMWLRARKRMTRRRAGAITGVRTLTSEENKFSYTWLVFYALHMWGTIRFLMALHKSDIHVETYDTVDFILLCLQGIGDYAQVICNALLFCVFDGKVNSNIFCCKNANQELRPLLQQDVGRRRFRNSSI